MPAATLMEGLPWSGRECATKEDLLALERRLERHFAQQLQQGLDQVRAEFATSQAAQTRTVVITVVFALVAAVASNASLVFIAAG